MARRTSPPFRADHVGSPPRPQRLLQARDDFTAGRITAADLRSVEDQEIPKAVRMQEEVGLQSATDGEFRRASWHMDFIYALGGISKTPGNMAVKFRNAAGEIEFTPASIRVDGKIRIDNTIFADAFTFLQSIVTTAVPKLTIPSPNMVHYRGGPASVDPAVYPDIEEFWADLAAAYADEVARLGELGCTYLQFDDTSLAYLNDPAQRAEIAGRGEDAEHMHLRYIRQINAAVKGKPAGMAVTTHMCRGNFRSSWVASGGYDFVAEALFSGWRWTGSSWSTTTSAPAGSSRCGSSRRARWSCWAWSPPSARSWNLRMTSSAASTRRPSTCRWSRSACPASAASPPPWRAMP